MVTSWLAGGDLWLWQEGGFDWLSHVCPSEGFNRTGSMEGPPCDQPGRYWSHWSHGPGIRINEADWESLGERRYR